MGDEAEVVQCPFNKFKFTSRPKILQNVIFEQNMKFLLKNKLKKWEILHLYQLWLTKGKHVWDKADCQDM